MRALRILSKRTRSSNHSGFMNPRGRKKANNQYDQNTVDLLCSMLGPPGWHENTQGVGYRYTCAVLCCAVPAQRPSEPKFGLLRYVCQISHGSILQEEEDDYLQEDDTLYW